MLLNVLDIPEEGLERELELSLDLGDENKSGPALARIRVFRSGKRVIIQGSVKVTLLLECSRCLKEFESLQEVDFSEDYSPAKTSDEDESELDEAESSYSLYKNDEIDITRIISEQVLLSLPMKPLCGENCEGICPKCGKDLNIGSCDCETEETDPRLAPLKKFRDQMKKQGS